MEEILNALKSIKNELEEQKLEIRETGKKVTEQVTQNIIQIFEQKLLVLEEKQEKIKEIVKSQETRIYLLEKQERKRNLVFFGIEETESSYENLENNIMKWIEKKFSLKLTYSDIQEVKRIGKKEGRPRPLVVTFATLGTKIKILKKKKEALKDSECYIKEDYPKYVLEKRKELQEQLKLEKELGNTAVIKYDKLIISKNNTKRKQPTSPKNATAANDEINTQINKKNRTQQSGTSVKRSNSISEGVKKPGVIKPGSLNFFTPQNTPDKHTNQNKEA